MNFEDKNKLLKQFRDGKLSESDADRLEALFISGELDIEEFKIYNDYESMSDSFASNSDSLDIKLQEVLQDSFSSDSKNDGWWSASPWIIKALIPLFFMMAGFILNDVLNKNTTQQMPLQNFKSSQNETFSKDGFDLDEMLHSPSTAKRLTMVKNAQNVNLEQNQIVSILFMSLNNDKNTSVRMSALDELIKYSDMPEVRQGLLSSLGEQKSSFMIQYIAQALKIIGTDIDPDKFNDLVNKEIPSEVIENLNSNVY